MSKSQKEIDQEILSKIYDYILSKDITDRERKIGLCAKADMERKRYDVAVLNQTLVSLQREAMKVGLTKTASTFYDYIQSVLAKISPFGLNLGYSGALSSYLDWVN